MKKFFAFPQFTRLSAITTTIIIIVIMIISYMFGRMISPQKATSVDNRQTAPHINATRVINKSYSFPVKDDKGNVFTSITYTLENASLQNQIIIKGQRAQAIQGKTFLIIDFSLTNTSPQYIQINSRDYIRLLGQKGELLAPDIYNDPIEIQPISTKESRLGFPVDETQKKFILSVGEIDGKKTHIFITL